MIAKLMASKLREVRQCMCVCVCVRLDANLPIEIAFPAGAAPSIQTVLHARDAGVKRNTRRRNRMDEMDRELELFPNEGSSWNRDIHQLASSLLNFLRQELLHTSTGAQESERKEREERDRERERKRREGKRRSHDWWAPSCPCCQCVRATFNQHVSSSPSIS